MPRFVDLDKLSYKCASLMKIGANHVELLFAAHTDISGYAGGSVMASAGRLWPARLTSLGCCTVEERWRQVTLVCVKLWVVLIFFIRN